jgi:mersacidin/lichenicidin family type 2 lantibiotic
MKIDLVRVWKDPSYRAELASGDLAKAPAHPAGLVEVTDEELKAATGLAAYPVTTNLACTMYTFIRSRCCA